MAWTAEDRRTYAPAMQEMVRRGMIVRLAQTMDALDPQPKVGRQRVWSALIMLQALWHLARDGCTWRRLPPTFPPPTTVWSRLQRWRRLAVLDRALAVLGGARRLPPPGPGPQAAADGGDHRHAEREDRPAARPPRL
jgi:transposase